jgi:hypothetical protein
MPANVLALLILSPFVAAVIYAGFHEYRRYKSAGSATYGLAYDEQTGTTHITEIADGEEGYDPEDFDPNAYNDPETADKPDEAEREDETRS